MHRSRLRLALGQIARGGERLGVAVLPQQTVDQYCQSLAVMGLPVCEGAAGCLFGADQITVITGLSRARSR
jgi:hypothetical protein